MEGVQSLGRTDLDKSQALASLWQEQGSLNPSSLTFHFSSGENTTFVIECFLLWTGSRLNTTQVFQT